MLGAGSGSEVLGLARVGVNVVGIERDAKQFRALTEERVPTEAAFPDDVLTKLAEDDRQIQVFKLLAAQFTKLNSDVASQFSETQESSSAAGAGDSQESANAGEALAADVLCPACGSSVGLRAAVGCAKHQCPVQALHPACLETCSVYKKSFCARDCADDHGCQKE